MNIDKSKIHRVLVRAPNWVGDAVMSLPALEALKENLPRSTVAVLAKPWVIPLLESHPSVDRAIPYEKRGAYPGALGDMLRTASEMKSLGFDLAVLFPNSFESALLAWLARIPYRLGYGTDGRGLLLSHAVPMSRKRMRNHAIHQVEYYLGILEGVEWKAESKDPRLFLSDAVIGSARSLLRTQGVRDTDYLLGLSPGAAFGPAKRWSAEGFAKVADLASEKWGARVVILGSGSEREIGEEVIGRMKHPALNLCGRTGLGQAVAIIGQCHGFVTNDSGLMHVAAALNVPTVAVFGSTNPVATGPRSPRAKVVRNPVSCSPCLKAECADGYRCLVSIQPSQVWRELEELRDCV